MNLNNKLELKERYHNIRQTIQNRKLKNSIIHQKIITIIKSQKESSILCYISTPEEVSTQLLIKYCWVNNIKVYVPFLKEQKVGIVKSWNDLIKIGKYYQPREESKEFAIDIAIVPGVVFDKDNNRIGMGGGWYDRFLSTHKEIYKIGLAFKEQIIDQVSPELHDIKMDIVITD